MTSFSEKQHDKAWINRALHQSTRVIIFIGGPVACFTAIYGKDLLTAVYGPQYASVAVPFAILLGSTLLRAAATPTSNIYFAIGRPELQRYFTGIRAVIILILIYPAVKSFGLTGAASASFLSMLIGFYFQLKRLQHLTHLDLRKYCLLFLHTLILSLPVVVIWIFIDHAVSKPYTHLIAGLCGTIAIYVMLGSIVLRYKARKDDKIDSAIFPRRFCEK